MTTSFSEQPGREVHSPVRALFTLGAVAMLMACAFAPISSRQIVIYSLLGIGSIASIAAFTAWRMPAFRSTICSSEHYVTQLLAIPIHHLYLIAFGLLLSLASNAAAGDHLQTNSPVAVPLWLGGITFVVLGLLGDNRSTQRDTRQIREQLALFLLLIIALALRTWRVADMPYVLSGDEGSVGLVGWEFLEGSRDNLLGLGWFSFPALYSWLLSLCQSIFGRSVLAIRLVSSITGTLTIAATYLAGSILFNRKVGLIAAAWLATFHYHVFFSRVAYNNIFDGLFLILTVALLYKGWVSNRRNDFLLFGLSLGFSQYFYTTSHAIPLILVLWIPWLHFRHGAIRSRGSHLFAALIVAGSITLPLILTYITQPTLLTFTAGRVSLLDPSLLGPAAEALNTTPLGLVLEQTLVTGLGLTVSELQGIYADTARPMLSGLSAIVFYLGLLISLLRLRSSRYAILLITLMGSLLIGGISIQAPSSQRLILLPPILALLCASSLDTFQMWLNDRWPRFRLFSILLLLTSVGWMMAQNIQQLFSQYFPNETYGSLNGEVTQEMVVFLQNEPPEVKINFVGGERMQFDSIPSMAYLRPGYVAESVETSEALTLPASVNQRTLFIVLPEQQASLKHLASMYPEGSTIARYNRHGRLLFYVRIVEPQN